MQNKISPWVMTIGLLLQIFSSSAFAIKRPPIQADHINLDYANKKGTAVIPFMTYEVSDFAFVHQNIKAAVSMEGSTFTVSDGMTRFSIRNILNFINYFDFLDTQDLNFRFEDSHFSGNIVKGFLGITGNNTNHFMLNGLRADCGLPDRDVDIEDDTLQLVIEICLGKGKLSFDEMTFPTEYSPLKNILDHVANATVKVPKIDRLQNFSVNLDNHQFQFNTAMKWVTAWNLSASGRIDYEADKMRYKIEFQQAHVGYVPARKFLFMALRKLNDPGLVIEEPYVYVAYPPSGTKPTR